MHKCKRGHLKIKLNIARYVRLSGPKKGKFVTICIPCNRFRGNEVRRIEREFLKNARNTKFLDC